MPKPVYIPFRPIMADPSIRMHAIYMTEKISAEEAALKSIKKCISHMIKYTSAVSVYRDIAKKTIKAYERELKAQKNRYIYTYPKTGKQIRMVLPTYTPKDKKTQKLFLHFYNAAKRDIKNYRHISDKTLELIGANKRAVKG